MKLLLAEDTEDLNRAVAAMLKINKYDVDCAFDGQQALEMIMKNGYDGLILDIMMPKIDGLQVLREIRAKNIVTPVLMLTAKAEIEDRVEGLNLGADDYLTKPFAMAELIARVNAMTRRKNEYAGSDFSFGNIKFSSETQELKSENSVRLSSKESETLEALLVNQNESLSSNYFIEHIWRDTPDADSATVTLYIKYLNNKLKYINADVQIKGGETGPFKIEITGPQG